MPLRIVLLLAIAAAQLGAQPQQVAPLARLRSNIERITKLVNADWGIYIKCIETGEEVAIDADRQMDTMSVIKITLKVWYRRKTFDRAEPPEVANLMA